MQGFSGRRRKRQVIDGSVNNATITFTHGFAVLSASDLDGFEGNSIELFDKLRHSDRVCVAPASLALGIMFFIAALFVAIIIAAFQSIQLRRIQQKC
jgi:capsular polysaccharide biosynthesis protein